MKIAIMGAGAVGCYFGAILARAGDEVTLIGRQHHVDAIAQGGLLLEMQGQEFQVPVRASAAPDAVGSAEIVLFCVKSGDTQTAGAAMAPYLAPDAVVISLQNGVDNAARLAAVLGRPVIPCVVHVAAEMAGSGRVRHHGSGQLVIGTAARSATIAAHFTAAGIPTEVSDNVIGALWGKLTVNCAYNAISAITQLSYGRMAQTAEVRDLMRNVVAECVAVAEGLGVQVPGDPFRAVEQLPTIMPGQLSSTAQDIARGRPSEIDHLNGYVLREGAALGVKTPVNQALLALVKLIEANVAAAGTAA